jgi:hypothetical protein
MFDPSLRRNPRRGRRRRAVATGQQSGSWKRPGCAHLQPSQDTADGADTAAFCVHRDSLAGADVSVYFSKELYNNSDIRFGGWRP